MISAVVLAADRPRPGGEVLFLESFRGKPVLQRVLETALRSDADEVICVVRDLAQARAHIPLVNDKLSWVIDYGADYGKSHALVAGLWAIDPSSGGAVFLNGDQPTVSRNIINGLIDRFVHTSALIVVSTIASQPRYPILFRRELFPELLKLRGEQDGRQLIESSGRTDFMAADERAMFALERARHMNN